MVVTKIQQNYRLNHQTLQHESYSRILSALVRPMSRLLLRCRRSCCLYRIRLRCYRHSMVGLTYSNTRVIGSDVLRFLLNESTQKESEIAVCGHFAVDGTCSNFNYYIL